MVKHDGKENGNVRARMLMLVAAGCVAVLGLLGIGTTAIVVAKYQDAINNQTDYDQCQRRVNEEFRRVLVEHAAATARSQAAISILSQSSIDMVNAILAPGATQEQRLAAIQSWRSSQAEAAKQFKEADATRRENPIDTEERC
jgi:hypothetical protein